MELTYLLAGFALGMAGAAFMVLALDIWRRRKPPWLREMEKTVAQTEKALEALRRASQQG